MRIAIEVEVFEGEMLSFLGTSEDDSTSEPETVVDVEFDASCSLTPENYFYIQL